MKKLTLILIAIIGTYHTRAQNINPESDHIPGKPNAGGKKEFKADSLLSNWCLDINITGGILTQNITSADITSHYLNAVNSSISGLSFTKGSSVGFDAEIAYFFNRSRNFGIGTGIRYMEQYGRLTMDNFHVEYQSFDKSGNTFRQVITADQPITESLKISNFNIPLLFKYKKRFSKEAGFTVDAGLMFNLAEKNNYTTNASFDYEAIYKYTGAQGGASTVYDNALVPGPSDLLITKKQYAAEYPNADVAAYFNSLRAQGDNVGLAVKPDNNSGNHSYMSGSVGVLIRPAVSFYLSDKAAINLGAYYLYQGFKNSSSAGMLTDKVGEYNSVLTSVSKANDNSFGVTIGVRFFLGKVKEQAVVEEVAVEEEKPVEEAAPMPNTKEEPAEVPEPVSISTPILFDVNKTQIMPESYPVLEEAVTEMKENKKGSIIINGYTDITGTAVYNKALSKKRALAVKKYLQNKGVNPKSLKAVGHGAKSPAESNSTPEGRAKNRRVVMKLKQR